MTVTAHGLTLYALSMLILVATPGPVWMAMTARALAGGFGSAWSLAVGVGIGHQGWPLATIFGLGIITPQIAGTMHWIAAAIFTLMGLRLIRKPWRQMSTDASLTRPSHWAGLAAGIGAVLANPNTILFYIGAMPGFFNIASLSGADVAAILSVSLFVPLAGYLTLALAVDRARAVLMTPPAVRRLNQVAGALLILAGVALVLG